ncbi:MAG: VIT1/CCC1 transporter family protein [Egibacteraceae bacterium]
MTTKSRYRRRLASELEAAAVYRALADRRTGEERESLLALARAEERHARYWAALLGGGDAEKVPRRLRWRTRVLSWLARRVNSLLVLALVQRAELDGSYDSDAEAGVHMAADERIHARVVAGLARHRRARASGLLRASVFGINDGLVSNVSLILGMAGAGAEQPVVLLAGLAGLLAGALSMAAGEYVSVRSQRELLSEQRTADVDPLVLTAARSGDLYRLQCLLRRTGMPDEEAKPLAVALLRSAEQEAGQEGDHPAEVVGTAVGAALSSFGAFAVGAAVPVIPYLVTSGRTALFAAVWCTGAALFAAGTTVGVLTGGPLLEGGIRQLVIGTGAATVTYALGKILGVAVS